MTNCPATMRVIHPVEPNLGTIKMADTTNMLPIIPPVNK